MSTLLSTLFRPGDRVCWIGDSITHGGLFHAHVTLFLQTRFPGLSLTWANRGLSGDSAAGALRRFDWDIAPFRPTLAFVMMGMNDVHRERYDGTPVDGTVLAARQQALDEHDASMTRLLDRLIAIGCRPVLLTPTPYDQTATLAEPCLFGVNDALATCAGLARAQGRRIGAPVIDLHGPLTALNARLQALDPQSTIIGSDRVHPQAPGHLAMAHLVLEALGAPGLVDRVHLRADPAGVVELSGCTITGLERTGRGIAFNWLAGALPFPLAESARPGLEWFPFLSTFSREELRIDGLRPGSHEVRYDGVVVETASADELAHGLDLGDHPLTPQHRQAAEVARHLWERHQLESGDIRTIDAVMHFVVQPLGIDLGDRVAVIAAVERQLEQDRASGFAYGVWQREIFLRLYGELERIQSAFAAADAAMRAAARPVAHHVEIVALDR